MFALAIQTGLRVSELIGLTVADIHLGTGPHVHCTGKGRKERRTPLLATTVAVMNEWLSERNGQPADPLFATTTGRPLSRDAVERRIRLATTRARAACPSLAAKQVTTHTLRHTAAMRLLHAGVDITVIALWLGHEQITTTNIYLHAGHDHQGERHRQDHPARRDRGPLPALRSRARLPRQPLTMPTNRSHPPHWNRRSSA